MPLSASAICCTNDAGTVTGLIAPINKNGVRTQGCPASLYSNSESNMRSSQRSGELQLIKEIIAGVFYTAFFPPIGLTKDDLIKLVQRAALVSVGSVASVYALQGGEIILMVSILATVSLWVLLFESLSYKSIPDRSTIIAAVIAIVGIVSLRFIS
jgi:hypothetical protein